PPLMQKLAARFVDLTAKSAMPDLGFVELIVPALRLFGNACQKRRHCFERARVRLKADQLRMPNETAGFVFQNFLSQQRLTPRRNQSLRVEITRMQCPQSHGWLRARLIIRVGSRISGGFSSVGAGISALVQLGPLFPLVRCQKFSDFPANFS